MAGAEREITDPVEAANHGIGSSKRLIAATLDDLSAHHSWLETYHRDERLRAERLRRRELRDRLERGVRHAMTRTKRAARITYVEGRRAARFSQRHALAFAQWASPRLQTLTRHTAVATAAAWSWSRQHTPLFTRRACAAARNGFEWSVQASEDTGQIFRQRVATLADEASTELWRRSAPLRRRGELEWLRTRLHMRRVRAEAAKRLTDGVATSQTLAQARKRIYRWTIRGLRISKPAAQRAHGAALRIEADLSDRIIRITPEFRRLLRAHMPAANVPAEAPASEGCRALIVRPNTALACVAPAEHKLPAPYHA